MLIGLDAGTRWKIFRQHRDLRQVLAAAMEVTTGGAGRRGGQRLPLLVALGLRLQRMMERHSAFEEAALRPLQAHLCREDSARVEALEHNHRQQRMELSLLTKLAFGAVRLGRVHLAFCSLSTNILEQMEMEERELFGGRALRKAPRRRSGVSGSKRVAPQA